MEDLKLREPLLYSVAGKKGVGKTVETKNLIDNYIKGNNFTKGRKSLIIDVNMEYSGIKTIPPEFVKKFSMNQIVEVRRILPIHSSGKVMKLDEIRFLLEQVFEDFRGGLLVIEDMKKYVSAAMSADIIGALCTNRHKDTDVIVQFQGIGAIGHPQIRQNTNILRYHKTQDSVAANESRFKERAEILYIAENIINKKYYDELEKRKGTKLEDETYSEFFLYVDFDKGKIKGPFTKEEFMEAVDEYIFEKENITINKLLKQKDREGNLKYKFKEALELTETNLFKEYYGNK